eukprot:1144687-Amorphochlora_amoeboformis.AAC.2
MSVVIGNHTDHRREFIAVNGQGKIQPMSNGQSGNFRPKIYNGGHPMISTTKTHNTKINGHQPPPTDPLKENVRVAQIFGPSPSSRYQANGGPALQKDKNNNEVHRGMNGHTSPRSLPPEDVPSGSSDVKYEERSGDIKISIKEEQELGSSEDAVYSEQVESSSYASIQRSKLMQEQATRRAAINKEQQNILMMMEKEDAFWKKQEDRFKLMVKRQNLARRTSDDLQQFLNKWNKVMISLAQGYRNLTQHGRDETGTLRQACIAQGILCKSIADHYSEMRERIFSDAGREAADLTKNMFTNSKQLEASGKRLSKVIKTARSKCMDSWVAYAKAVNERQRLELANKPVTRDPFVACRLYDRDVAALRKQEMLYRKEMTRLFRDFKVEDGRRIDKTQSIMLDYLLAQKAMLEDGIKFTESAIEAVKGIDREADVEEFIRQADLLVAPSSSSDTKGKRSTSMHADNVFEVQPPHRDPKTLTRLYAQECQCQGPLYRQGKFLRGSWKQTHVVLSRSGFFHQFDSKNAVQPEVSICLRDCKVNLAPKEDQ